MSVDKRNDSNQKHVESKEITCGSTFHDSNTGEIFGESKEKVRVEKFTRNIIEHIIEPKKGRPKVQTKKKKLRGFSDPYIYCFKKGLRDASRNDKITGQDFRVLLYILSWVGVNNVGLVSQASIAANLKIQPANVAASVRRLAEERILQRDWLKDQNHRKVRGVRLNANLVWCGEAEKCNPETPGVFFDKIPEHRVKKGEKLEKAPKDQKE